MSDPTWLRDALRRATAVPPPAGDRAARAFAVVTRRRRQRLVAASCTAALAVVAATAVVGGGAATTGIEPVSPTASESVRVPSTVPDRAATRAGTARAAGGVGTARGGAGPDARDGGVPRHRDAKANGAAAPAKPVLEVYFLIDATGTMAPLHDDVALAVADVVDRLGRRVSLRHGFGVFRDTTLSMRLTPTVPVYERLSPVRPNGGRLPRIEYAGGGDVPEAHTFGLEGALGREHAPWMMGPPPAGFSGAGRRLVVLVTDGPVKQDTGYPTVDETIAHLNAAGVAVAALVPKAGDPYLKDVTDDMAEFARYTNATAPRAASCDAGRSVELRRGAPLVCEFPALGKRPSLAGFADAVVARFAR